MRHLRKKPRSKVQNQEKIAAASIAKKNTEEKINELMGTFKNVNEFEICQCLHPFEESGLVSDGTISPIQKAITYCMKNLGGWATDEQILAFFRKYWSAIVESCDHNYKQIPDKRVLHINYAIQKERRALFVKCPTDPNKWGPNTMDNAIEEPVYSYPQEDSFQHQVLSILRKYPEGMTLEELLEECKEMDKSYGLFANVDINERIKLSLYSLKDSELVQFDEATDIWTNVEDEKYGKVRKSRVDDILPIPLRGIRLKEHSIDELWDILTSKGVY